MTRALWTVLACAAPLGCGAANNGSLTCTPQGFLFSAGPALIAPVEPDHLAKPPGNQEQFQADAGGIYGPGCATPQVIGPTYATWTVADTKDVQISSAQNNTNGLATCLGATNGPALVTATQTEEGITETKTSSITCK